jgi:hypothetical protein
MLNYHSRSRGKVCLAQLSDRMKAMSRERVRNHCCTTIVHPGSYSDRRASPLSLNEPHQSSTFPSQHHLASLRNYSHSNRHLRPPPRYDPLLSSTFNETAPQHRVSLSSKHRAVPRRESLAQWKAEREEAKPISNSMRCTDTKENERDANEMELKRKEELTKKGKRGYEVAWQNERGCLGEVMR